jgi:predicted component of type VI protein secretion system
MATLTWQTSSGRPITFTLHAAETWVGRDPSNTVRLDSTFVSKRHAVIRLTADGYVIADAGSSNGTLVNGRAITTALLRPGDRIEFGSEQLVFENAAPAAAVAARPAAAPAASAAPAAVPARRSPWLIRIVGLAAIVFLVLVLVIGNMGSSDTATPTATDATAATAAAAAPVAAPQPTEPSTGAGGAALAGPAVPLQLPPAAAGIEIPPDATAGALYDQALAHIKGGRLLEASRYLQESLARDPTFTPAQYRFREVVATIQVVVDQHFTAAQRAFAYLRFQDAISEWEQVVGMTDPSDQRHQQALAGLAQARARLGQQ